MQAELSRAIRELKSELGKKEFKDAHVNYKSKIVELVVSLFIFIFFFLYLQKE